MITSAFKFIYIIRIILGLWRFSNQPWKTVETCHSKKDWSIWEQSSSPTGKWASVSHITGCCPHCTQGYLFCSFAEFFNSAKNSQDCEKWKKTTKFTRILSRFWVSPRNSSMGQNLQKWASISQNGSKWAIFSEIHNTIGTNSSQWALICSKWV